MQGDVFNDRHAIPRYLGRRRFWSSQEIQHAIESDNVEVSDAQEAAKAVFDATQVWILKQPFFEHQYKTRNTLMMAIFSKMAEGQQWANRLQEMDYLQSSSSNLSDEGKERLLACRTI